MRQQWRWSEDIVNDVLKKVDSGLSYRTIAGDMSKDGVPMTRNVVAGIVYRSSQRTAATRRGGYRI